MTAGTLARNEDDTHTSAISPRECVRVVPTMPAQIEGAGNAGCALHPQSRVQKVKSTRGRHHRFTGAARHSPRNGFNGLLRDLPGDRALLSPSSSEYGWSAPGRADSPPQNLTPASRRQDHTTSPSASAPFVSGATSVHRIPPRVRDDRDTPLRVGRDEVAYEVIWVKLERKCFRKWDWTAQISLIRLNKFGRARSARTTAMERTAGDS